MPPLLWTPADKTILRPAGTSSSRLFYPPVDVAFQVWSVTYRLCATSLPVSRCNFSSMLGQFQLVQNFSKRRERLLLNSGNKMQKIVVLPLVFCWNSQGKFPQRPETETIKAGDTLASITNKVHGQGAVDEAWRDHWLPADSLCKVFFCSVLQYRSLRQSHPTRPVRLKHSGRCWTNEDISSKLRLWQLFWHS